MMKSALSTQTMLHKCKTFLFLNFATKGMCHSNKVTGYMRFVEVHKLISVGTESDALN